MHIIALNESKTVAHKKKCEISETNFRHRIDLPVTMKPSTKPWISNIIMYASSSLINVLFLVGGGMEIEVIVTNRTLLHSPS
ncbi:hypothetical protein Hanom_Chr12g01082571 [Helianthus anomalus]